MNERLAHFKQYEGKYMTDHSEVVGFIKPKLLKIEEGYIKAEFEVRKQFLNSGSMLHGGITSLIMDEILGGTTFTLPDGKFFATANLNVHFLSSAHLGDLLHVEASIIKQGNRLVHVEGKMYHSDTSKIIASATADLIVINRNIELK